MTQILLYLFNNSSLDLVDIEPVLDTLPEVAQKNNIITMAQKLKKKANLKANLKWCEMLGKVNLQLRK